jgi:hypothetical protein
LVVAATAGLIWSGNATWWLALGLALLLVGGWSPLVRPRRWDGSVLALVGAVSLGFGPDHVPGPLWVRIFVVVATIAVASCISSFEARRGELSLPLLALAVAGIYLTTPDTEQSAILLGAIAGIWVVGGWFGATIGRGAAPATAGLIVWTLAVDGRGRHSAIIGGLACLGLLLAEPISALIGGARVRLESRLPPTATLMAFAVLQAAVVGAAREAGIRTSTRLATYESLALLCVAADILLVANMYQRAKTGRSSVTSPPSDVSLVPETGTHSVRGNSMAIETSGISRRDVLKKGAVAGAVFWAVPVIESVTSAASAGSSSFVTCSFSFVVWEKAGVTYVSGFQQAMAGCTNFAGKPGGTSITCSGVTYILLDSEVYIGSTASTPIPRATSVQCSAALIQNGNTVTAAPGVTLLAVFSFGGGSFGADCPSSNTLQACKGLA